MPWSLINLFVDFFPKFLSLSLKLTDLIHLDISKYMPWICFVLFECFFIIWRLWTSFPSWQNSIRKTVQTINNLCWLLVSTTPVSRQTVGCHNWHACSLLFNQDCRCIACSIIFFVHFFVDAVRNAEDALRIQSMKIGNRQAWRADRVTVYKGSDQPGRAAICRTLFRRAWHY